MGLICKGGESCDEPLPVRIPWSCYTPRGLKGRYGSFRWGGEKGGGVFVMVLVELWQCVHA